MVGPRPLQLLATLVAVMLGTSGPLLTAAGRRSRDRPSGRARSARGPPEASLDSQQPTCTDPDTGQQFNGSSNSFLWSVHRDPPSYLFGTIHVPYTSVWDYIPANSKAAFYQSEFVVFELDLMDPFTISALNNCQLLPNGEYLSNVIPRNLYERLKSHIQYVKVSMPNWITQDQRGRGLYADYLFNAITGNWERKRPVYVMLMINALTEADIQSRGTPVLDLFLTQEAHKLNKRTAAVEEVQEHCVPLNDMNVSQVLFALNQTLWLHESHRRGMSSTTPSATDLIGHYNCGDLNAVLFDLDSARVPNLVTITMPPQDFDAAQEIDSYFRQELIHKRNERMAERIHKLLDDHPRKSFFFAFGAGHFLGNDSVIDKLQTRGFQVQHTPPDQSLPGKRKRQFNSASSAEDTDLPPLIINGNLEYLDPFYDRRRNRHRHERGRKRGRNQKNQEDSAEQSHVLKQPEFNELWVKIDAMDQDSLGSSDYLRQEPSTHAPPQRVYKTYNQGTAPACPAPTVLLLPLLLTLTAISHYITLFQHLTIRTT